MLVIATQLYHSFSYSDIPYDVDFTIPYFSFRSTLVSSIFVSQGFLMRTLLNKPLTYRAIKSLCLIGASQTVRPIKRMQNISDLFDNVFALFIHECLLHS